VTRGLGGYPSGMRNLGVSSGGRVDVRDVNFSGVGSTPTKSSFCNIL
jgi:hypothetical protein